MEEISSTEEDTDASPLGSLQKGTIDLTGITVGEYKVASFASRECTSRVLIAIVCCLNASFLRRFSW